MKNFKKVIAFLLVAAMTLGMGTIAFADEEAKTENEYFKVVTTKVDDSTVKAELIATKDIFWFAGACVLDPEQTYVDTSKAADGNTDEYGDYNCFLESGAANFESGTKNYTNYQGEPRSFEAAFLMSNAASKPAGAKVAAGTTVATIVLHLVDGDAPEVGTSLGIFAWPEGIKDEQQGAADNGYWIYLDDLTVLMPADAPAPTDPSTAATTATTAATANTAKTTAATAATAATTAATTKSLTDLAKSIVTETDAMNALTQAGLDVAVAAANKLNKSAFANDADYKAFQDALTNATNVLKNPKATQAEKDAALKALEAAMAKADDAKVIAAVKAALNEAAAANNSNTGKNAKTGDAAPVAALMLVAIAAFGTAVVVYRKKVNA